mgnify:FL=1
MNRLKEKYVLPLSTELRAMLGRLSPGQRLTIALTLLGVMVFVFVTVIGYGLYRLGHEDTIRHMPPVESIVVPDFVPDTLPEQQLRYLDSLRRNRLNDPHDDISAE